MNIPLFTFKVLLLAGNLFDFLEIYFIDNFQTSLSSPVNRYSLHFHLGWAIGAANM